MQQLSWVRYIVLKTGTSHVGVPLKTRKAAFKLFMEILTVFLKIKFHKKRVPKVQKVELFVLGKCFVYLKYQKKQNRGTFGIFSKKEAQGQKTIRRYDHTVNTMWNSNGVLFSFLVFLEYPLDFRRKVCKKMTIQYDVCGLKKIALL